MNCHRIREMNRKKTNTRTIARFLLEKQDKEEKVMKDKIILNDEKSRKEFDAYLQVWERSANVKDFEKVDVNEDWAKVRTRMSFLPRKQRIPLRSYALRIAAILILAFGLTYFLLQLLNKSTIYNPDYYEIASASEIVDVDLPDGSIVSLNKNAKIFRNSDFGKTNRDVILEGEAFFKVTKNKDLPFRIHSMNSTVEVLGTSFNVKTDTNSIIVSVMTGKVAFYLNEDNSKRLELNPDNAGKLNISTKEFEIEQTFDPNSIAWYTKEFVFRNKPLEEVCNVIAKYYQLDIIKDDDLKINESITITCSTQSVQDVLSNINLSLTGDVELIATKNNLIIRRQ